ncbi:hypothetical protein [Streptomyces malaysiensis]|uniref:hypothetical protein n=1 Tax=Streptomyces malaysiensis TaxID=92644 RepID=UPI0038508E6F
MANSWNTDNAGVTALAAGDFDGDGHDDLALGEWVSQASPRRATPSARRSPRVTATPTVYRTSRSDPFGERASLGAVWLFRRSSPGRAAGWPRCGWRPWGCPSRRRCRSRWCWRARG